MKFSNEFIERVSEANNLVDVISQYTQLKPTGSGLMGRCPFPDHQEKTASFSVSESKQVYHCFGCGKSGNIFTFLKEYQGLSFPEAVEFLAGRASIPMPIPEKNQEHENKDQIKKKALLKINKLAQTFFVETLSKTVDTHPVKLYLKKRGLSAETIQTFSIGYAPPEWEGLVDYLKARNVSLALAEEAQLVRAKSQGGFYDLFKDRLMFPIQGPMGDVLAFGGRIIDQGQPKYLNSPESPVFTKGRVLYGLPQTAKFIRTEDFVIVVEGYMDLVSLYQAGIKNVVAIMGTALTHEHARLMKRLTRNVLVLLDGDQAGQTAAERALPILLSSDLYPKGYILPEGQDPDDFVKTYGPDKLLENLRSASDLMSLVMNDWLKNYKGEASEKIKFLDRLKEILQQIPDQRLRDLYWQEAAAKLKVDASWVKRAVSSNSTPSGLPSAPVESKAAVKNETLPVVAAEVFDFEIKSAPLLEKNMAALAIKSRANFESFQRENAEKWLTHEGIKKLFKFVNDVYGQDRNQFDKLLSQIVSKTDEPQALFFKDRVTKTSMVVLSSYKEAGAEGSDSLDDGSAELEDREQKLIRDLIKRMKETSLKNQLKQLAQELKLNPTPEKIEQLKALQKNISELNQASLKSE